MSSGRLPIVHRCFILRVLVVVCACLVEAPYCTSLLYIVSARSFVCISSGRLHIGYRCFILRVLEVVCACLVGDSLLDIVALYCEC